jgi:uncharacterized protein YggU (UPF0235/DUF167 family)
MSLAAKKRRRKGWINSTHSKDFGIGLGVRPAAERQSPRLKEAAEKVAVASRKQPSAAKAGLVLIRYVRAKARTLQQPKSPLPVLEGYGL